MEEKSSAWYKEVIRQRDNDWIVRDANQKADKAEKTSNFSLGFSVFTLLVILFVELIVKKCSYKKNQ